MFEGRSWSGNERNCCFLNTGGSRWADVSAVWGFDFPDDSRAVAVTDWDHDGDLDLWITNRNAPRLRFLRNDAGQKNHFLALRLQGVSCNRDAIGARVTVELAGEEPRKLYRTLYAGDAYQSQSTKWLIFGLGDRVQIKRAVVQWPDGRVQQFDGLAADRRYRIVQGQARAEMLPIQHRQVNLIASTPKLPPSSDAARIVLANRVPLPNLAYRAASGSLVPVTFDGDGMTLLNLWAAWCRPCVAELTDLVAVSDRLRSAGLRVIALNVEGLDDKTISSGAADSLLARLKFPFTAANATTELVDRLEVVQRTVLDIKKPLPLPSSFLIDGDGRVVAIYRGPLDVDRLLRDVAVLGLGIDESRKLAVPLRGRRLHPPAP
ncbi:MAG: ASPIC/UnbV domain-containing protein, partial [Planctomycetes bacterium]|nr:ASPIC/UnbV domain-containing protein [Planctomycetota bacterium]